MRTRSGQAMIEFLLGMLTLVLLVTALCGFVAFMTKSLRVQNSTRVHEEPGGTVKVGIFFGPKTLEAMHVREHVNMPSLTILQ